MDMLGKHIETPLGKMVALGDKSGLQLLAFLDQKGLNPPLWNAGTNCVLESIEDELTKYFAGQLKVFKTPIAPRGTYFRQMVWKELAKVHYGTTISYAKLAKAISKPSAFRAVAGANAANPLAIILPCHRVINKSGALGGYAGGLERKRRLLSLEMSLLS